MTNEVGSFIQLKRKKSKMSLRQLGEEAGVSYPYISMLEKGKRDNPSAEVLNKIAGVLDIPSVEILMIAGYLIKEVEEESSSIEDKRISLYSTHPLDLLELVKPDVLADSLFYLSKKLRVLYSDEFIKLNLQGLKKEITTKEIVDVMVTSNKELLHVYIFMVAMADSAGVKLSDYLIWKFIENPKDKAVIEEIEGKLGYRALTMWRRVYFEDDILVDYGDYKLSSSAFTLDMTSALDDCTLILDGKVINPQIAKDIKALLLRQRD